MIKLTSFPEDPDAPQPEIYINPNHITVLEPQEKGTLIGLYGQGVLRVKENIDIVLQGMKHPNEWMH
jgi:hypothetical protein